MPAITETWLAEKWGRSLNGPKEPFISVDPGTDLVWYVLVSQRSLDDLLAALREIITKPSTYGFTKVWLVFAGSELGAGKLLLWLCLKVGRV